MEREVHGGVGGAACKRTLLNGSPKGKASNSLRLKELHRVALPSSTPA